MDYIDLFIEAYHLYENGFKYLYNSGDRELLDQLHEDYVQKSDADMLLDEYVDRPGNIVEPYYITNLDMVIVLSNHFPQFSNRINVPTLGKKMVERGFKSLRRGKKKIRFYGISPTSKILQLIDPESQSYKLNRKDL